MKITAGLGSIDEYERFVRAGADEFFCGYVPFFWAEKYGTVMPLNRREVLCYNVQLGAYSELEILSRMVEKYKKPVHLTFNSLYYLPEQYPEIASIIERCMKLGFQSYIIADPMPNLYFTRDNFASVGNGVTINKMFSETRNREVIYAQFIFTYHPDYKNTKRYYSRDEKYHIEGGDILNLNSETIAVGISQRTEKEAIEKFAQNVFSDPESDLLR